MTNTMPKGIVLTRTPEDLPWHWQESVCHWPPLQSQRQIRILKNLRMGMEARTPDKIDALVFRPIFFCDLEVVDYDDPNTSYHALSYSWGPAFPAGYDTHLGEDIKDDEPDTDDDGDEYVLCSGGKLPVTKNLALALIQLCKLSNVSRLWIDMITIHQNDIAEKNSQVALMDCIYSHAMMVLVWLGPLDSTSKQAIDLMSAIKKKYDSTDLETRPQGPFPFNDAALWTWMGRKPLSPDEWRAIGRFFTRTWFRRVWMVQEIALARATAFMCGGEIVHWSAIWGLSSWLRSLGWDKELELDPIGCFGVDVDGISALRQLFDLSLAREQSFDSPAFRYEKRCLFGARTDDSNQASFLGLLLIHFRKRWATDDRDQLYGFLGILRAITNPGETPILIPDYNKSMTAVFTEAAQVIIDQTVDYGMLSLAGCDQQNTSTHLPSWVPDLTSRSSLTPIILSKEYNANAGWPRESPKSQSSSQSSDEASSRLLRTEGILFDKVLKKTDQVANILSQTGDFDLGLLIDFVCDTIPIRCQQSQPDEIFFDLLTQGSLHNYWSSSPSSATEPEQVPKEHAVLSFQWWVAYYVSVYSWNRSFSVPALGINHQNSMETLQSSDIFSGLRSIPQYYERFLEILEKDRDKNNQEWDQQEFRNELLTPMRLFERLCEKAGARCFLRTRERGVLALGPSQAQEDDEIWILKYGRIPLLLRPTTEGRWRLIGEVYLPGFMDGELCSEEGSLDKITEVVLE